MDDAANAQKHILVVSQYFYPEQFRINDICAEWVKRGYKVTVVTGIPNYPQGKFYSGYGFFKKRKENYNGVEIIRLPLIARGKGSIGMIANYFSFVISGFFWKLTSKIKADLVFTFEVSPMTQALLGVWYAKKHKVPNFLYVQDLWPENIEIIGGIHNKLVINSIGKMVNYIYANCDRIFATSPSFVAEIQKRCENKNKVTYWPQYAEDFYKPASVDDTFEGLSNLNSDGTFKIAFTGNIGQAQGLDILPKTASILKSQNRNVKFIIVGDGRSRTEFEKNICDLNVEDMFLMLGRQPAQSIPVILAHCQAAFLSFMNAALIPGIDLVIEVTGLEEYIKNSDLVITGEGRLDSQSCMGKAPMGVSRLAKKYGKVCVALSGCVADDAGANNRNGIDAFFPILKAPCSLSDAMDRENAGRNLADTAQQVMRLYLAARG